MLIKWINKAIKHNNFSQKSTKNFFPTVLVIYLYYNEYEEGISEFTELPETGLTKGLIPCNM